MSNWLSSQILLLCFNFVVWGYTISPPCQLCSVNHYRLPAFDGTSVSDFPLTTQGGLGKLWMCTRMCSKDSRCRSYRYNSMTGACSTYDVLYKTTGNGVGNVSTETGSQLYQMCGETRTVGMSCSSTSGCDFAHATCRDDVCECSLGYSYDVNTGDCVTHCERYGDFFLIYPDHGVSKCNMVQENTPTSDECVQACTNQTAFVCINVEYQETTKLCNLCDLAWFDLNPAARRTDDYGWVLYYRQCAV